MNIKRMFAPVLHLVLEKEGGRESLQAEAIQCFACGTVGVILQYIEDSEVRDILGFFKSLEDMVLVGEVEVALKIICTFLRLFNERTQAVKIEGLIPETGKSLAFMEEFVKIGIDKLND